MATLTTQTFTRPSRSGGPTHVVILESVSHAPVDIEHPCSCAAGVEGRFCWALLEILQDQGGPLIAASARALAESRKSGKKELHR